MTMTWFCSTLMKPQFKVGISVSFSKKMEARLKQEHGFEDQTLDVFISCTHTVQKRVECLYNIHFSLQHTGPQTHDGMIGMGNANTGSYLILS